MTTTSTAGIRRRARDSDDDVDTGVFHRPPPLGLDRAMVLQIMRELEPRKRARPVARPLSARAITKAPNVFLTPWSSTDPPPPWAQPLPETCRRSRLVRKRSRLPWFVLAMSFAIAFGILGDPVLRRQTASQVQSSTMRLWRFVSRIRT